MIKRHLVALPHQERCDRAVLIPALEKLEPHELQALWRLLQHIKDDAARDGARKGAREFWRHL
tara:strand:- start:617 stop:805 length:189 start_codon:yes stop_codon:yes gene_type:complete